VSRICSELDLELALFRDRPLDDAQYPYVWFDATAEDHLKLPRPDH
jgi:putative transposase